MHLHYLPVDLHTHTLASDHAYSTVFENIMAAKNKGLQMIAITDHGPKMADAPHYFHYYNQKAIPNIVNGLIVLRGIEANFLRHGETDCSPALYNSLDIVIGACHPHVLEGTSFEENTDIIIKIIQDHKVDILTHLGDPLFPKDHEAIISEAVKHNVAIEINSSSGVTSRLGSTDNCIKIAKLCKKYNALVSVNSDAHFCTNVGAFDHAFSILESAQIEICDVLNSSPLKVLNFLKERGHNISSVLFEYADNLPKIRY